MGGKKQFFKGREYANITCRHFLNELFCTKTAHAKENNLRVGRILGKQE